MARNMSFMLTTEQARNRTKTVTRRFGWWDLEPGDVVQQVEKAMGLKKGEKMTKIHLIRIKSADAEYVEELLGYGQGECAKEGFPQMTPEQFMDFICDKMKKKPTDVVNRIEFEYID